MTTTNIVLGLCAFTHDSAAALLANGDMVGFAEEERLTGDKHTAAYPQQSVAWLLDTAGITPASVDVLAYNFDGRRYLDALPATELFARMPETRDRAQPRADSFRKVHDRFTTRMAELQSRFPNARIAPVLHHRAHGLYAFASSGYDAAAVLVVDSLGEVQSTTIGSGLRLSDASCRTVITEDITDPASLGYAYGAVTEHLGWRRGDEEGTVMALAALGDPCRFRSLMREAIVLTERGFVLNPPWFPLRVLARNHPRVSAAFIAATCPSRDPAAPVEPVHADLAAALQERTEEVMVHLARRTRAVTGMRLLCVGGGVAANCVAVGKIVEAGIFDEVHVPPAPGDSGTAIGAALAASLDATRRLPTGVADRCYLGPAYTGLTLPDHPRPGLSAHRPSVPAKHLAIKLAEGYTVGLFHGRMEAGPRALGNRSILASPLLSDVVDRLNATVKFREPFRPFAPVVLASAASDYFTLPQLAPYMSIASGVTALTRDELSTIVHVNDTARVQTVTPDRNPFLAEVLAEFAAITGHPVLINTSLNVKGKPICGTPDMALNCLTESGLDALMLEGWWVTKC
ncbi:Decarbamoylnovobiocin carbamoyltransferase [Micromonospora sp. MH33]|uniref:carbamoyltransferase family protein n=1 Tax=Micromonospora sp. MH33 TaxID=1945509 RepID=UPI000D149C1D|nr:carbamoyltransferase C-terminal domain-containing protein [Micromonospora sp. MH33]PSK64845.1 Decarbamoylnovobiocin carbamoyltransferase [Micromonospora sp. MH33]